MTVWPKGIWLSMGVFAALAFLASCSSPDWSLQKSDRAILVISDSPVYDFGIQLVGSTTEKTFTITNVGARTASGLSGSFALSIHFSYKDDVYPGTGGSCDTALLAGDSCSVVVVFRPKYIGPVEQVLRITYSDGSNLQATTTPNMKGKGVWGTPGTLDSTFAGEGWKRVPGEGVVIQKILGDDQESLVFGNRNDGSSRVVMGRLKGEIFSGWKVLHFGSESEEVREVLQQSDGKLLFAGRAMNMGVFRPWLARTDADGIADASFGTNGVMVFPVTGSMDALVLQLDHRILAGATVSNAGHLENWIWRFESNGTAENNFGNHGLVIRSIPGVNEELRRIKIQSGLPLLLTNTRMARLLSDGSADSSFGSGGEAIFSQPGEVVVGDAQVDGSNGTTIVGTSGMNDVSVWKFHADGSVNTAFGGGRVNLSVGSGTMATSLKFVEGQKVLVAGMSGGDALLFRIESDGNLDNGFGNFGRVLENLPGSVLVSEIQIQTGGKIFLVGGNMVGSQSEGLLMRFWP